jgi:type IV pilus assembly protein PilM
VPEADEAPTQRDSIDAADAPAGDEAVEGPGATAASGAEEVEPAEALSPQGYALERLLERHDLSDGQVVTYLPDGRAMTLRVEIPFDERAKVERVLPGLLADRLPMGLDELVYDFRIQRSRASAEAAEAAAEPPAHEALVGLARREVLGAHLADLQHHGVDPHILGIPELMLGQIGSSVHHSGDVRRFAIVDMGHERTRVVILDGGEIVESRTILQGGRDLTHALAEDFDLSFEQAEQVKHDHGVLLLDDASLDHLDPELREQVREVADVLAGQMRALMRDLRRTLQASYARAGERVERLYLCGGASRLRNMAPHLESQLGVAVERLEPDTLVGSDEGLSAPLRSESTMALSLALWFAPGPRQSRTIDLRLGPFAYRGKSSYLRRQLVRFGAAAAVLLVLLGVVMYTQLLEVEAQRDAMRAAVSTETKKLFDKPILRSSDLDEKLLGGQEEGRNFIPKISAYELMHRITQRLPRDIELDLERYEVDVERNLIQIEGRTDSLQQVDRIVSELEKIECLNDIEKGQLKKTRKNDKMAFTLEIQSGCS